MAEGKNFIEDFHWLMDVLQHIDVGLVILDKEMNVQLWNSFMQNHSARQPNEVLGHNIFKSFPELPEAWFRRKIETVIELQNQAFTTWEQRPYLFKFKNYRPITSLAEFMYQNSTIIPLKDARGNVEQICIIIYDVTEVAVNRIQIQEANEKLRLLSRTDGLTGLLNRKTWESELCKEFQRFARHQHKTSLVMFDIDHFKKINDGYGHPAGDEVIRQTSRILQESLRNIDIPGRYGGEEFTVIMIDTEAEGAYKLAERIRENIQNYTVKYEDMNIDFTISLGVCELNTSISDQTAWIDAADKGLYQAKNNGRNNTVIYTGEG
ncbi:MAG: diguanylate cyclase [Agarilytica sp.]